MRTKTLAVLAALALAFLLVTNPVVVDAAKQLTGAQIKNDSLTGKDVKEETLKGVNARKLRGKKSEAYTSPTYRYRLPTQPPAKSHTYQLPGLPAGTYLATFNGVFQVAAVGKAVLCRLQADASQEMLSYGAPAQFDVYSTASSAAVVSVSGTPNLFCTSQSAPPDNWSVFSQADTPSVVTFTRVDATKVITPTATRTVDRRALSLR
jgi:hypothetical protein